MDPGNNPANAAARRQQQPARAPGVTGAGGPQTAGRSGRNREETCTGLRAMGDAKPAAIETDVRVRLQAN
eukprot:11177387-Lingulodinium_polyedra.AAC.1